MTCLFVSLRLHLLDALSVSFLLQSSGLRFLDDDSHLILKRKAGVVHLENLVTSSLVNLFHYSAVACSNIVSAREVWFDLVSLDKASTQGLR